MCPTPLPSHAAPGCPPPPVSPASPAVQVWTESFHLRCLGLGPSLCPGAGRSWGRPPLPLGWAVWTHSGCYPGGGGGGAPQVTVGVVHENAGQQGSRGTVRDVRV